MATTIGDNAVVIDYDDDFIRAGYAVPEREPGCFSLRWCDPRDLAPAGKPRDQSAIAASRTGTSSRLSSPTCSTASARG